MSVMTRRTVIASLAGGAVASLAASEAALAGQQPSQPPAQPRPVTALPPHWMDEAIGQRDDAEEIAKRIATNKKFVEIVARAVKEVRDNPPRPGLVGPTYPQRIRVKILAELCGTAAARK